MGLTVSLGEGNTPLLPAPRLSERLGCEVWLKWEGTNPTGSMRHRGMALAVSRAVERGAPGIVVASTGNTAASAAAYAARAGLPAIVLLPEGAVAAARSRRRSWRAPRSRNSGTFEDAHREARRLAEEEGLVNVNSINPIASRGRARLRSRSSSSSAALLRTCSHSPTAAAGTPARSRWGSSVPGRDAEDPCRAGGTQSRYRSVGDPDRRAGHREQAEALAEVVTVTDDELLEWWRATARLEGVFCELASAAGVAGLPRSGPAGRVVCVLTGHGLKDPDAVERL